MSRVGESLSTITTSGCRRWTQSWISVADVDHADDLMALAHQLVADRLKVPRTVVNQQHAQFGHVDSGIGRRGHRKGCLPCHGTARSRRAGPSACKRHAANGAPPGQAENSLPRAACVIASTPGWVMRRSTEIA